MQNGFKLLKPVTFAMWSDTAIQQAILYSWR